MSLLRQPARKNRAKKILKIIPTHVFFLATMLLIILLLTACDDQTGTSDPGDVSNTIDQSGYSAVVATINGVEISREDFLQALEQELLQYERQGMDLRSPEMADLFAEFERQILESYFIIPVLLEQKAEQSGIEISEQAIESLYQEYIARFGGEEQLRNQMEAAGISKDQINQELHQELKVQKYLEQYIEGYLLDNPEQIIDAAKIEVTEDELNGHYNQILDEFNRLIEMMESEEPELPVEQLELYYQQFKDVYGALLEEENLEEVMTIIENELREEKTDKLINQKRQQIIIAHIAELMENSSININL